MARLMALVAQTDQLAVDFKEYKESILRIDNYAYSVYSQTLPTTTHPLDWYQEMSKQWMLVRSEVGQWNATARVQILEIPSALKHDAKFIKGDLDEGLRLATKLKDNPTDARAKERLQEVLREILGSLKRRSNKVVMLLEEIQTFDGKFDTHLGVMKDIIARAENSEGVHKGRIDAISKEVEELKRSIVSNGFTIGAGALVAGAGVIIGIVGIVLAPATGGGSLTLLIPAAAVLAGGVAIIVLGGVNIANAKKKIDVLSAEANSREQDIVVLKSMMSEFQNLSTESRGAREALRKVQGAWETMHDDLTGVMKELERAQMRTEQWQQVADDLSQAQASWQKVVALAEGMEVPVKIVEGKLKLPKTEEEVRKHILDQGKLVSLNYLMAA